MKPTPAAMRAAMAICQHPYNIDSNFTTDKLSEIIDREAGLPELIEALQILHNEYTAQLDGVLKRESGPYMSANNPALRKARAVLAKHAK